MDEKDSQDIAWLVVAGLGLVGAWRIWTLHVRPWATEQWSQLRGAAAGGDLDGLVVDIVGVLALALPVILLLLLVRGAVRRRRRRAAQEDLVEPAPTPTTKTTGRNSR